MALSETQIRALPEPLVQHFRQMERDIIARISKHIGEIGELTATDIQRLDELQRVGFNVREIQREIKESLEMPENSIHAVFAAAAQSEYEDAKGLYDFTGARYVPFEANEQLQGLVRQVSAATQQTFANISQTRTIGLVDRGGALRPVADTYRRAVDFAILQVQEGQADFHSAMRSTIRKMAGGGLQYLEWESGYRRRLDSSVRMNMLGGLKQLSAQTNILLMGELGTNLVEVTAHSGARTGEGAGDHSAWQGKVYEWRK